MVPTLSLNPPASFLLPPPLSPVRCIHGPPPSSCDCSPFSCDRRGLCVKRDARPHPSYSCVRCKTPQSVSVCRAFSGGRLQTDNLLSSCCSAELDRRSPLSILHPPPPTQSVHTDTNKCMMGATAGTKAQPSNQVMESIKSITQTSKHNHIFLRLRGGQQRD